MMMFKSTIYCKKAKEKRKKGVVPIPNRRYKRRLFVKIKFRGLAGIVFLIARPIVRVDWIMILLNRGAVE